MKVCPVCGRDSRGATTQKHSRPVEIPGGVASVTCTCTGSGQPAVESESPAWIAEAFGDTR